MKTKAIVIGGLAIVGAIVVGLAMGAPMGPLGRMVCRARMASAVREVDRAVTSFRQAYELAKSAPRLALTGPIKQMQDAYATLEHLDLPSCEIAPGRRPSMVVAGVQMGMSGRTTLLRKYMSGEMYDDEVAAVITVTDTHDDRRMGASLDVLHGRSDSDDLPDDTQERQARILETLVAAGGAEKCHAVVRLMIMADQNTRSMPEAKAAVARCGLR